MLHPRHSVVVLAVGALLAACGGGGDDVDLTVTVTATESECSIATSGFVTDPGESLPILVQNEGDSTLSVALVPEGGGTAVYEVTLDAGESSTQDVEFANAGIYRADCSPRSEGTYLTSGLITVGEP
jgi:hypothetical protein